MEKLKDFTKHFRTYLFEVFTEVNNHKSSNLLYMGILVTISYSSLLSSIIPLDQDMSLFHWLDGLVLRLVKYSNFEALANEIGITSDALLIGFLASYIILICLYAIVGYGKAVKTTSLYIYPLTITLLKYYTEIYFWVLFPADLQVHIRYGVKNTSSAVLQAISLLTIWVPVLYTIWIRYSEFETYFVARKTTTSYLSTYYWFYIATYVLMSLIRVLEFSKPIKITLNGLFAFLSLVLFFKEIFFAHHKMQKIMGAVLLQYGYSIIWISISLGFIKGTSLGLMIFIGLLLSPKLMKEVRRRFRKALIEHPRQLDLSPQHFIYLMTKITTYLHVNPHKQSKASLNIIIFLVNHKSQCQNKSCSCKTLALGNATIENHGKLFEKSITMRAYKKTVYNIIDTMFRDKINNMPKGNNRYDMILIHSQFLSSVVHNLLTSYTRLKITQNREVFFKTKYISKLLQQQLEVTINLASRTESSNFKFESVLDFYATLESSQVLTIELSMEYEQLLDDLKQNTIDWDKVVKSGDGINAKREKLFNLYTKLLNLNPRNSEALRLIEELSILYIIDSKKLNDLAKKNQLIRNYHNLGSEVKVPEVYHENAIIVFITLAENKLGQITKCSPNIVDVLGYSSDETCQMNIRSLMPNLFGVRHDDFLKEFLRKSDYRRLNKFIDVFAIDRFNFLYAMDLYLKMEPIDGELLVAGYLMQKDHLNRMMLDEQGMIAYYDEELHRMLGQKSKSEKDIYGTHISFLILPLMQYFLQFPEETEQVLFPGVVEANEFEGIKFMKQKSIIILPKKRETIHLYIRKMKSLMSSGLFQEKDSHLEYQYLKMLESLYDGFNPQDVNLYSIRFNYKLNMQRPEVVKLTLIEIEQLVQREFEDRITKAIVHRARNFIRAMINLHFQYNKNSNRNRAQTFKSFKINSREDPTVSADMIDNNQNQNPKVSEENNIEPQIEQQQATEISNGPEKKNLASVLESVRKNYERLLSVLEIFKTSERTSGLRRNDRSGFLDTVGQDEEQDMRSENPASEFLNSKRDAEAEGSEYQQAKEEDEKNNDSQDAKDVPVNIQKSVEFKNVALKEKDEDEKKILGEKTTEDKLLERDTVDLPTSFPTNEVNMDDKRLETQLYSSEGSLRADGRSLSNKINAKRNGSHDGKGGFVKNASSQASGRSNGESQFRYLISLLKDKTSPKFLISIQIGAGFSAAILIILILIQYLLYNTKIQTIKGFCYDADFTNEILAGYALFVTRSELDIMINENMITGTWASEIEQKSTDQQSLGYNYTRNSYKNSFLNSDIQSFTDVVDLANYKFKVTGIGIQNSADITQLNFAFAISKMIQSMQDTQNMATSQLQRSNPTINFLRRNFAEYFNNLLDISSKLLGRLENEGNDSDFTALIKALLILSVILNGIMMIVLLPIYRRIEHLQEKGLGLMTTITSKELDTKINQFRTVGNYLKNVTRALITQTQRSISRVITKGDSAKAKQPGRVFRNTRKKKKSAVMILGLGLLTFSLLIGFNLLNSLRMLLHLDHISIFVDEVRLASETHAFIHSLYFISYYTLNEWNETSQGLFTAAQNQIFQTIKQRQNDLTNFMNVKLKDQLSLSESYDSEYENRVYLYPDSDICELLSSYYTDIQNIDDCKSSMKGINQFGLPTFLNRIYLVLSNIMLSMEQSSYSQSAANTLVSDANFDQIEKILPFADRILNEYRRLSVANLHSILENQMTEAAIFFSIGLILILGVFVLAGIPFSRKLLEEFQVIKNTMFTIPVDLVISNNYLKKFLKDNSSKSQI